MKRTDAAEEVVGGGALDPGEGGASESAQVETSQNETMRAEGDAEGSRANGDAESTQADGDAESTRTNRDTESTQADGDAGRRRAVSVNGRILQADWRAQLPAKGGTRDRLTDWAARYPLVGELAGELRSGDVRKVFWQRPTAQVKQLWARRPSSERVREVLIERRVLIAGVAVVAICVAADGQVNRAVADRPLAPGEAQRVAIAYPPQIQPNPQSARRLLDAIARGEKRREAAVVAAAARATLARAKAEAAAASSGEWQPWMGERAPVVPGAMVPGGTPSGGGFSLPAKGAFTSGFGSRWGTMHRGIDIAGPIGSPIYAVADGTVVEAGPAQGFGLWVRIRHDDGTISIYGHMYDFVVSQGERVPAGMQIARIGNRGDSTGPHLHFEIMQNGQHVDPQVWLALHGLQLN
ncbi:M23 family metallopeptidase [Nocardia halotolerans]|uniref:M23 family metallopeptidase n=1 Tax=Nocardia halotolerans TaxID=1755878 RepID=A0ABV8VR80_9NOCA